MGGGTLFSLSIALLSAAGFLHSVCYSAGHFLSARAEVEASALSGSGLSLAGDSIEAQVQGVYETWEPVEPFGALIPVVDYKLGRAALAMATSVSSPSQATRLMCSARDSFRRAAQRSPHTPKFHISLADVESQVPQASMLCGDTKELSGEQAPRSRLKFATGLAPYNSTDTYYAAVAFLAMGERKEAFKLFRRNDEFNPLFTSDQRHYVYRLIENQSELETAVARRYPGVLRWVEYFQIERPDDYDAWKNTFVAATHDALDDLFARLKNGEVSSHHFSSFVRYIARLPLAAQTPSLRKVIDRTLSQIYTSSGDRELAALFEERAGSERIPVLKSVIFDDFSPDHTMLFGWHGDMSTPKASLDVVGKSFGLFFPSGWSLDFIMLESHVSRGRLAKSDIELLGSSDNLYFHKLVREPSFQTMTVDGREVIVLRFDSADFRYLKVRYTGTHREPKFYNELQWLGQAYGRKIG